MQMSSNSTTDLDRMNQTTGMKTPSMKEFKYAYCLNIGLIFDCFFLIPNTHYWPDS